MSPIETERLALRRLTLNDAAFVLRLLNDPSFIQSIGDRGIRTLEGAQDYLRKKTLASYERHGAGMGLVSLKFDGTPIGICGLFKRDPDPDFELGFAFLPPFWGKGYAVEAAAAAIADARRALGVNRIIAATSRRNAGSVKVLEKLGLRFEKFYQPVDSSEELQLFARDY